MKKVIVYSTPSCMACRSTQALLEKASIDYEKIDVSKDQDLFDRLRHKGYYAVPIVEIVENNNVLDSWVGFRPDKISQISN